MSISAFTPTGPTVLVGTSAVQVTPTGAGNVTYRVRNINALLEYLTWGATSSITSQGAPSSGTPSAATIGMNTGGVEYFTLPAGSYFIASAAASFEITPGI